MNADVDLLVVGMRKSGTSWLYENCIKEKKVGINEEVKETSFFCKRNILRQDIEKYNRSFRDGSLKAEFDASICYSDNYTKNIMDYSREEISLRLIVRNPVEYLASRYIHSIRKGEIKSKNIYEAIEENKWLYEELNYPLIIERFLSIDREKKMILPFDLLESNPNKFKNYIFSDFEKFKEFSEEKINQARVSKIPLMSQFLAKSAKAARKNGLHNIVNIAKSTGINRFLEVKTDDTEKKRITNESKKIIQSKFKSSLIFWEKINEHYS